MAKGNLFLGTARGKVGDVVIYQREGTQVSRKYVAEISNPRSVGQSIQRNYLAPVARFYSPLAGALERSWEGLNKAKSTQAFNSTNVKLARSKGWFLPKGSEFFPLPYKLSKGILPQLTYGVSDRRFELYLPGLDDAPHTVGVLSQVLVDLGWREGDQLTFILVSVNDEGDYTPSWSRMIVDTHSTVTLRDVLPAGYDTYSLGDDYYKVTTEEGVRIVAGACIMSRYEGGTWRRSTQYLALADDLLSAITSEEAYRNAISTYGGGSSVVLSDVYLNGGTAGDIADSQVGFEVTIYDKASDETISAYVQSIKQATSSAGVPYVALVATAINDGRTYRPFIITASGDADSAAPHVLNTKTSSVVLSLTPSAKRVNAFEDGGRLKDWLVSDMGVSAQVFE